jgi:hypothetical protein
MRLWKWIGVAGLAGVAATGAVVARNERQRRAYTPDDVRARLHERAAAIEQDLPLTPTPADQGLRGMIRRLLRRTYTVPPQP